MNKAELKAINIIATKMNWMHKPVCETIETIKQMVSNQQALMMDTIGECDDFEDELLTLAIQDADKIVVLDQGKVVGIGKHQELLKNCEVYKEIALSQLTKEELEYGKQEN